MVYRQDRRRKITKKRQVKEPILYNPKSLSIKSHSLIKTDFNVFQENTIFRTLTTARKAEVKRFSYYE